MGLPDEIYGVPVTEGYPGTHAQAIDPGDGTVPSRGGRFEAPPSRGYFYSIFRMRWFPQSAT